jgi:hypothetical protein
MMETLPSLNTAKKIVGGRLHQSFVPQSIERRRFENAFVAFAAAVFAACLQLRHGGLPGAFHKGGVAGRQVGAGQL